MRNLSLKNVYSDDLIRAQMKESYLIFKFPSALLVSVIIGVTNVIPFFGPFIGAVPATLLILIQNPIKALWFVLVFSVNLRAPDAPVRRKIQAVPFPWPAPAVALYDTA